MWPSMNQDQINTERANDQHEVLPDTSSDGEDSTNDSGNQEDHMYIIYTIIN